MDDDLEEQLAELAGLMVVMMKENASLKLILGVGADATITQLKAEIASLRERNAGLMDEKNAAIRAAKSAARKVKS